jgi:hypothetical protein
MRNGTGKFVKKQRMIHGKFFSLARQEFWAFPAYHTRGFSADAMI